MFYTIFLVFDFWMEGERVLASCSSSSAPGNIPHIPGQVEALHLPPPSNHKTAPVCLLASLFVTLGTFSSLGHVFTTFPAPSQSFTF